MSSSPAVSTGPAEPSHLRVRLGAWLDGLEAIYVGRIGDGGVCGYRGLPAEARFCRAAGSACGELCAEMRKRLGDLVAQREGPLLLCCWAGAKLLAVPIPGPDDDAHLFLARSPNVDEPHLRGVAEHQKREFEDVLREWLRLPQFGESYAEDVVTLLGLDDEDPVARLTRRLAAMYERRGTARASAFHLDTRLFQALAAFQTVSDELGILRVDVVQLTRGDSQDSAPVVRWFRRAFAANGFDDGASPIRGFCLDDDGTWDDLTGEADKGAWRVGAANSTGRRTFGQRLGGDGEAPADGNWVHPTRVDLDSGQEAVWDEMVVEIHATTRLANPDRVFAGAWLRTAAHLSLQLDTELVAKTEDSLVPRALGWCAFFLDDPRIREEDDKWQRVLRALHVGHYLSTAHRRATPQSGAQLVGSLRALSTHLSEWTSRDKVDIQRLRDATPEDREAAASLLPLRALALRRSRLSIDSKRALLRLCHREFSALAVSEELTRNRTATMRAVWYATAAGYLELTHADGREAWRQVRGSYSDPVDFWKRGRIDHVLFEMVADPGARRRRDRGTAFWGGLIHPLSLGLTTLLPVDDLVRASYERPYIQDKLSDEARPTRSED